MTGATCASAIAHDKARRALRRGGTIVKAGGSSAATKKQSRWGAQAGSAVEVAGQGQGVVGSMRLTGITIHANDGEIGRSWTERSRCFAATGRWSTATPLASGVPPLPLPTKLAAKTSYGATRKAIMATTNRAAAVYNGRARPKPTLIPNPEVRCPCCADIVAHLPPPWTIQSCQRCRRPLTLVRMVRRPTHYQLRNVIDVAGAIYGTMTMLLVLSFVLSEMNPRTFAKAVTILMFIIGSLLMVDGALSLRTAIDRTWMTTRYGTAARVLGVGKTIAGTTAIGLAVIGLHL